ncbi:MAG TPA: DNA translocase FtsK 4TM domain-containing protein, partial [Bacillota bacterium]|nr:DNA translocase FtsK 4TM domain-containing protein [Bacillota bacterium]
MAAKRKVRRRRPTKKNHTWALVVGMVLFAFAFAASMWPDSFGILGESFQTVSSFILGSATPFVTLLLAVALAVLLTSRKDRHRVSLGFMMLSLVAAATWHLSLPETIRLTYNRWEDAGGGLVGWLFVRVLSYVGFSGTIVALVILALTAFLAVTGASAQKVFSTTFQLIWKAIA